MISKVVPVLVLRRVSGPLLQPGPVTPRNGHSGCYRYLAMALVFGVFDFRRGWLDFGWRGW
jgi:hypothetical protein